MNLNESDNVLRGPVKQLHQNKAVVFETCQRHLIYRILFAVILIFGIHSICYSIVFSLDYDYFNP